MGKNPCLLAGSWLAMIVLAFALGASMSSHALNTWWKIEKSAATDREFVYGLYRVCPEENDDDNDKCYKFVPAQMTTFVLDTMNQSLPDRRIDPPEAETDESKRLWILAFFCIVLTGISFLLSLVQALHASKGRTIFTMAATEAFMNLLGGIMGICVLSFAIVDDVDTFKHGVEYLVSEGLATGDVEAEGTGFILHCCTTAALWVACIIHLSMVPVARKHRDIRRQKSDKENLQGRDNLY